MDERPQKRCCRCGETLPLCEFHKDAARKDGHCARCKDCVREITRMRYAKQRIANGKSQPRSYHRQISKYESRKRYNESNPEKVKARQMVSNARHSGFLPNASDLLCVSCGESAREWHHPDYKWPLYVVPLCRACHKNLQSTGVAE
jgi:hypothetical protein